MAGRKKLKKWRSQARRHAAAAEQAAQRAEAALARIEELGTGDSPEHPAGQSDDTGASRAGAVYTAPRGTGATPPAAEVP